MKTVREREWRDHKGKTKGAKELLLRSVPSEATDGPQAMVSDVLLAIANFYAPTDGLTLNTPDVRKFNKAVDKLEQVPVTGKFELEDDHFEVLKRTITYLAPKHPVFALDAGEVEDLFNQDED